MFEAVLVDFYGTLVHEDDAIIARVCETICQSSAREVSASDVGTFWWQAFSDDVAASHGEAFQTQRLLEHRSLVRTCEYFDASCDPDPLSELLFDYWRSPPIFQDTVDFLAAVDLPVVVVSNIDRDDISKAIAGHGLRFAGVITSEDVRSYKPRPEPFLAGLDLLGTNPADTLHVGDSVTGDVVGASAVDIPVAWINRKLRKAPDCRPDFEVADLAGVLPILRASGINR